MTMKSDVKFEEKLTLGSKNDMRNLVNFHPTTQKFNIFNFLGNFCPKYMRFEIKKYRGVIFNDTERWCNIWINSDLAVSKMASRIGWIFIRALKVWKTAQWSLCEKCPNTEFFLVCIFPHLDWIRRDTGKYGPEKTPYLDTFHAVNGLFVSIAYNVSARKSQRNYVSWHWRVIQNL